MMPLKTILKRITRYCQAMQLPGIFVVAKVLLCSAYEDLDKDMHTVDATFDKIQSTFQLSSFAHSPTLHLMIVVTRKLLCG